MPASLAFAVALAFLLALTAAVAESAPSSSTGKIVFSGSYDSSAANDYDLVSVEPDTEVRTSLTAGPESDRFPEHSPDGGRIAFTRWINPSWHLYVMSADGSGVRQLTSGTNRFIYGPAWSPDGQRIAFQETDNVTGEDHIVVINDDGTNEQIIATGYYATEGTLSWSAQGEILLANLDNDALIVMNDDGTNVRTVTTGTSVEWPEWSPDGSRISYAVCTPF